MTSNPYVISPEGNIADALELMRNNRIRRLPVVKSGKLVGIVTESQMLEVSPSKATTLSIFEINYLLSKTKISSIMTKDVKTISPDSLLEEAALLMADNEIGALPVVEGSKLVGIITEKDIYNAFIDILGFRDKGSRITVAAPDTPGVLADIAQIIKDFGANISHLAIYGSEAGVSDIVIRVNSVNIDEMLKVLEGHGYKVVHVLKNEK
jgi:acetoin utilization protein AcuB